MIIFQDVIENTDLTREELEANIPEDLDPISTTDVKIRDFIVRYFIHKGETFVTYIKTELHYGLTEEEREEFIEEIQNCTEEDLGIMGSVYSYCKCNPEDFYSHARDCEKLELIDEELIKREIKNKEDGNYNWDCH